MYERLEFECENGHTLIIHSGDPYYPEWAECMECGEKMTYVGD